MMEKEGNRAEERLPHITKNFNFTQSHVTHQTMRLNHKFNIILIHNQPFFVISTSQANNNQPTENNRQI